MLTLKKGGNSDACYRVDEPGGKKPVPKEQISHDFRSLRYLEQSNSQRLKGEGWVPEARGGGGEPVFNGDGVSVWEDEDVPRMGVDRLHNHDFTEYPTTVHLKRVKMANFVSCIFYHNLKNCKFKNRANW